MPLCAPDLVSRVDCLTCPENSSELLAARWQAHECLDPHPHLTSLIYLWAQYSHFISFARVGDAAFAYCVIGVMLQVSLLSYLQDRFFFLQRLCSESLQANICIN